MVVEGDATKFNVKHQGKVYHQPPSTIHKWPFSDLPRSTLCPSLSLSFTILTNNVYHPSEVKRRMRMCDAAPECRHCTRRSCLQLSLDLSPLALQVSHQIFIFNICIIGNFWSFGNLRSLWNLWHLREFTLGTYFIAFVCIFVSAWCHRIDID